MPEAPCGNGAPECSTTNEGEAASSPVASPGPRSAQRPPAVAPTPAQSLPGARAAVETQAAAEALASRNPWRIDWCTLLKRTFDFDVLRCECGGSLKVVALVTDRETACEILERLGLPTRPPPLARARSPDEAA